MNLDKVKKEFFWISWLSERLSSFVDFTLSFLEMHMNKIVSLAIMAFCCFNANPLHMLIVILLVFSMPMGYVLLPHTFRIIGIYLAILLLTKMTYQTKFIPKSLPEINCKGLNLPIEERIKILFMDVKWMGYVMLEGEESILQLCGSYLLVLLVMTLRMVVQIRQRIKRIDDGKAMVSPDVLYPEITRKEADVDIRSCFKYLVNYGFYKFGIELTLTTAAFVIAYRMDVMSSFYSCWLLVMFSLRRSSLSKLWPFFFASIILSLLWQYAMVVGLSPQACIGYPWKVSDALGHWLFLAKYDDPPDGRKMLADFILLVLVWRQKVVFDIEEKYAESSYPGGSNKEVFMDYYKPNFVNPVPDQTSFNRSGLDWVMNFFVTSTLWITLAFVYWTGVYNVNVLSLGYLVGSFVFLWIGYDLCLWHIRRILRWWNILLAYTIMAILFKSVYEVAGCVYIDFLNQNACWLVQLLNLGCANENVTESTECLASRATVMYWDAACFGLMLFQRRIFLSYYFLHQVEDVKTLVHLQSRGAQLIEQLMQEQIADSENRKMKTLQKIKKNMNRMKEWQKKIQGLKYMEPTDHATAVHMGDYYMFEEALELDTVVDEQSSSSEDEEGDFDDDKEDGEREDRKREKDKELTMTQFIGTVFKRTTEDSKKEKKRRPSHQSAERIPDVDQDVPESTAGGTSELKAADEQKDSATDAEKEQPKLKSAFKFITDFIESVCVSTIRFFDKHSKDYRYINAAMIEERKATKLKKAESVTQHRSSASNEEAPENEEEDGGEEGRRGGRRQTRKRSRIYYTAIYSKTDDKGKRRGSAVYAQLIISFFFFVMSHTEFFCYVMIFLHQALSPTILSLPLPLCALLWGSLTTIRPTTTFWIVLIAYTEVTVVIKATFQNWIFPWNSPSGVRHHPYHPPLLLGIHRNNTYATADLFLLFMLFLHRYKLKRLGMWKRTNEEETLPPRDFGVYNEILQPKDEDDDEEVSGLKRELRSRHKLDRDESARSIDRMPHLAKWKCTSRAMATLVPRGRNVRTKLNVQEIEGHILVTHKGLRLKPTQEVAGANFDASYEGNIVLRVYSSNQVHSPRNLQCKLSCLQHITPLRKFFMQIMDQKGRLSADFYTLIFFFDFLTFLIVFFGFSHFTEVHMHSAEEHFYLTENQVPLTYLFAVLIHFLIIITDRVLYLRKNVLGKLVLQITLVIIVHLWMFLILPRITDESFTEMIVPQIYYLMKCLYFLMSAYQMRVGYPLRVQGHFLCKRYGYVNYFSFKGLQFIPFFNQLRVLLDYVCIHSSLSIMEWIKMESIFQLIFENKCARKADEEYPSMRGIMYPRCKKYVPGTSAFTLMVFVMWLPFFLFAIFETVSEPNQPKTGTLEVTLGPYKIYKGTAAFESIIPFTHGDFDVLKNLYKDNKKVWSFLSNYKFEDVAALKFRVQPLEDWKIRATDFDQLNRTIQSDDVLRIYLSWRIFRTERAQIVAASYGTHEVVLPSTGSIREGFIRAFTGEENRIFMEHMMPKFMQVTNEGNAMPVAGFFNPRNRSNAFRNITLRLIFLNDTGNVKYWEMRELADDEFESSKIRRIPYQDEDYITIYTFNAKNIPKPLLNISRRGIIGLYLSTVLVSWTFIKKFMCKYPSIMFEDMPNVDRVLQLCQDIYLARESHEFALEEDLYAKLIFLFRSPETLIKWTRRKPREEMQSIPD